MRQCCDKVVNVQRQSVGILSLTIAKGEEKCKLFKAQDGRFRLFWRLLSYAVLFVVVGLVANVIHSFLAQPDSPSLLAEFAFAVVFISGILGLTYLYRRRLDRRPWSGMALSSLRKHWIDLVTGSTWVLILMPTPLVILAVLVGQARIVGTEVADSGLLVSALAGNVAQWIVFWPVALLGRPERGDCFLDDGVERGLGALSLYTRSIWAAIGLHTVFNWVYTSLLGFSSNDGGYGHALLHFEIPNSESAAVPVNPVLGDIGSVLPNIVACGVIVLILLGWNHFRGRGIDWRAKLESDGSGEVESTV